MDGGDFCKDKQSCLIGVVIGIVIALVLVFVLYKMKMLDSYMPAAKAERCINSPLIKPAQGGCERMAPQQWQIPPLGERFYAGNPNQTPY